MYNQEKKDKLMENEKEIKLSEIHVDFLSERDVEILTNIGVPESISPYIDMISEKKFCGFSLYDRVNIFEKQPVDRTDFKDLCLIGEVSYGYVIITKKGEIDIFDIENDELQYVNKSLDAFLDTAYEYALFVKNAIKKYGENVFLDCKYCEEDINSLRENIVEIDENAIEEGFWSEELERLLEDIEG